MSTHASARLVLSVVGFCTLCACHDATSKIDALIAKPQKWIEDKRRCDLDRINHRTEHCAWGQAEADRRRAAAAGDR